MQHHIHAQSLKFKAGTGIDLTSYRNYFFPEQETEVIGHRHFKFLKTSITPLRTRLIREHLSYFLNWLYVLYAKQC